VFFLPSLIPGPEEDFMGLKATAYGTLCLTALSLCLWGGGCGSKPPPLEPGRAPGYFGKGPGGFTGGFKGNDAMIKDYYAAKKKGKAKTKPQAK
jgi:hypothetical protein